MRQALLSRSEPHFLVLSPGRGAYRLGSHFGSSGYPSYSLRRLARLFCHSSLNHRIQRVRAKDVLARSVSNPWSNSAKPKGKMSEVEEQKPRGVRIAVEGCVSSDLPESPGSSLTVWSRAMGHFMPSTRQLSRLARSKAGMASICSLLAAIFRSGSPISDA
jgi:hypothetical protein